MPVSALSRFAGTPVRFQTEGGAPYFAEWRPPEYAASPEADQLYVVTSADLDRPDLIAFRLYGTVELWWVLMHYNAISDPFALNVGDRLRFPSRAAIEAALAQLRARTGEEAGSDPREALPPLPPVSSPLNLPYIPPPYQIPGGTSESSSTPVSDTSFIFTYSFPVPCPCDQGTVHFQVQVSADEEFSSIVSSKMTAVSQSRWFYYDPEFSGGAFRPFPAGGVDSNVLEGQVVYHSFSSADGLIQGGEYWLRHRAIVDMVDKDWTAGPPVVVR